MISFNSIPVNIRVPGQYIEFTNENANRGLLNYPTKLLYIGQKLASGTADALVPKLITSVGQAKAFFGRGSQLAHMLERAKATDDFIEMWAIAQVDDPAGVKASGSFTVTGNATASGTLFLYMAGRQVKVKVNSADSATAIATAIITAINADLDLPVTALVDGVNTSKVNLTARNAGDSANTIDLRINNRQDEETPAGITVAVTPMTGGTGNPDVADAYAAIGDTWFTDIVMSSTDEANIAVAEQALALRNGPLKMIEAIGYIQRSKSLANLVSVGQSHNSELMVAMGVYKGLEPSYEWAAVVGTVCAKYGQIDPAMPLQTLPLPGLKAPAMKDRFTKDEQNILLFNGHSTYEVDAGGAIRLQRVITTYRKNGFGADDVSYLNLETMKTLFFLRYDVRTFIALRFPRFKLAPDGTAYARGQNVVTPDVIRNALIGRAKLWVEAGLITELEEFKRLLLVEIDGTDPDRVNVVIPPTLIGQWRVTAAKIDFRR